MRKINYAEWKTRAADRLRVQVAVDNRFEGRAVGRRPRDPEKERLLTQIDIERLQQYKATGKLQIIGSRKWKWRIDRRPADK